jgi:hypothetical protein
MKEERVYITKIQKAFENDFSDGMRGGGRVEKSEVHLCKRNLCSKRGTGVGEEGRRGG